MTIITMSCPTVETPRAPVSVVWSAHSRYWAVTVERCPLCGRKHCHGGGDGPEPDLGWRASHCLTHYEHYYLVETAASLAARQHTPAGCLGQHCAVRIGHQVHRCSGCEWGAS
jgi:hypothetical protein